MNERLKQEFQKYLDENDGIFYPEQTAQHFYNLALEDVRKSVVDIREGADRYSEAHTAKRVLNRIDELKRL